MGSGSWCDESLPSKVRVALWLRDAVGVGQLFTIEDLRTAIPGVAQIDRRMRDLREFGWVIHAKSSDASLKSAERRFVKLGDEIWAPGYVPEPTLRISSAETRTALLADDFMCRSCGIGSGQDRESGAAAQLVVRRLGVKLVTVCEVCRDLVRDIEQRLNARLTDRELEAVALLDGLGVESADRVIGRYRAQWF